MRKRKYQDKQLIVFHKSYLFIALSFILTGYYLNLIAITLLIIIHELGHYSVAKLLKFRVTKIIIYPYGGLTKIEDLINRNINEELLIAISGIAFQSLFYIFLLHVAQYNYIRANTIDIFRFYHYQLIFFNLLPIYPLDGSKIITLLLNKFINYNLTNKITIFISLITLALICTSNLYHHNYSYLMILTILLTHLFKFYQNLSHLYNKLLLERYIYKIKYPQIKIINNPNHMYKNKTHIIKTKDNYIQEKKYLDKYFHK